MLVFGVWPENFILGLVLEIGCDTLCDFSMPCRFPETLQQTTTHKTGLKLSGECAGVETRWRSFASCFEYQKPSLCGPTPWSLLCKHAGHHEQAAGHIEDKNRAAYPVILWLRSSNLGSMPVAFPEISLARLIR